MTAAILTRSAATARAATARAGGAATAASVAAVLVAWELIALVFFPRGDTLARPTAVVQALIDERSIWWPNIVATLSAALAGLAIGTVIAAVLAALAMLTRWTERVSLRIAAALYAMPIVAIGPLLQVRLSSAASATVLATFAVIFTALVSMIGGLHAATRTSRDISHAFGGNALTFLVKVRVPYAFPSIVAGIRIAYPAAVIGALIGEFLGAQNGLGVLVLSNLAQMQTAALYAAAVVITAVTALGYYLLGLAARLATRHVPATMGIGDAGHGPAWKRGLQAALTAAAVAAVLIGIWVGYLKLFRISAFVGKGPGQVWEFFTSPQWADQRAQVWEALGQTIIDAGSGLALGWCAAAVAAAVFVLLPPVEKTFMPLALALRSVPIVAILPLLTLLFGRGLLGTAAVIGIVVFFPTLILMTQGLRAVSPELRAVSHVYYATRWQVLTKVQIPTALPAATASLRIAAPASILGALLAEWMATGKGVGYLLLANSSTSDYSSLWSAAVLMTVLAVLIYCLTDALERRAVSRFDATHR